MSTTIIVRIAISIYALFAGGLAIFLWRNPASSDSLKATGILAAGLIPATIVLAPLFKSRTTLNHDLNAVLFFNEKERTVVQTIFDPYSRAYFSLTANLDNDILVSREISNDEIEQGHAKQYWTFYQNEKGLDLMERLVLITIAQKFQGHWDITSKTKITPTGSQTTSKYGDEESREVKIWDLAKNYSHNEIIKSYPHEIVPPMFHVPVKCKINIETQGVMTTSDKRIRRIEFNIPGEAKLSISLTSSSAGPAGFGVWGLLPPNKDLYSLEYRIDTQFEYRENAAKGKKYLEWYENMLSALNKLSWDNIDTEIEKGLMRQLLSKP